MLLVRSRSNYRVPSASQHKSRSFVELVENRFCTHFLFVLFARTHSTYSRSFLSHASVDHRFVFLLFRVFLFFLRSLSFSSLSLSLCSSLFGRIERDGRFTTSRTVIKDLPWNKFADIFFWYWAKLHLFVWKKF